MPDNVNRVRDAIVEVLKAYGIAHEASTYAITFTYEGHTRRVAVRGGDFRAHKNAKTRMRRILHSLGATPLVIDPNDDQDDEQSIVQAPEDQEFVLSEEPTHQESEEPVPQESVPEPIEAIAEPVAEASPAARPEIQPTFTQPQPEEQQDMPVYVLTDRVDESIPQSAKPGALVAHTDSDYVVLRNIKYTSQPKVSLTDGRFIAVNIEKDLIVPAGYILVIPLDVPNLVWPMPPEEFLSNFEAVSSEQSDPSTVEEVEAIEPSAEDDEIFDDDEIIEPSRPQYPPPVAKYAVEDRSPVAPQLGRILLAMRYLIDQTGNNMSVRQIQDLLPSDARSTASSLTFAIKGGYVTRIAPGRYRLASPGVRIASQLGTAPFDQRSMEIPQWMR